MAVLVPGDESQRRTRVAVDLEEKFAAKTDVVALEGLPHAAVEFGVVGLPHAVAGVDAGEVDVAAAEAQHRLAVAFVHVVDAAALFLLVGPAGVKNDAIARLGRALELEVHAVRTDPGDEAEEDAALGAEARVGQLLVLDATKPAGVESARESHFQVIERFAADGLDHLGFGCRRRAENLEHDLVQRLPVDPRDVGHVFGALEPALDLQRRHAGAHEVGEDVEAGKILRTQQVAAVAEVHRPAVGHELVGHAAGLGAFAAVGGAAAQ